MFKKDQMSGVPHKILNYQRIMENPFDNVLNLDVFKGTVKW